MRWHRAANCSASAVGVNIAGFRTHGTCQADPWPFGRLFMPDNPRSEPVDGAQDVGKQVSWNENFGELAPIINDGRQI